ncbi:MAG TPA: EAL domain-containing protein [Telluria sp.]|nr:EAL domain-containing protein [Telluria sp.]
MTAQLYPRWHWQHVLLANLVIVLIYLSTIQAVALLAIPPGYPSPLFPPAGVQFALAVLGGWRVLPAVAAGPAIAFLMGAWPAPEAPLATGVAATAAIMAGAVLQAWLGARYFRRWIHPAVDSGRDVIRFLLLAPLMCVASASVAITSFYLLGLIPAAERVESWISWWAGDTIGVLLAAPLTWIVCALPRPLWQRRAVVVALPLLVAAAAVVATYELAVKWERDQRTIAFRLKAQQAADLMQAEFSEHQRFVQTFARALGDVERNLSQAKFLRIASGYADGRPEIQGISWAVRVPAFQRGVFEAWARANVDRAYEIREVGPGLALRRAAERAVYFPLLYTTPFSNRAVLGLDFLGDRDRAAAVARSMAGPPAASAPLRLVATGRSGVSVFKSVGGEGVPAGLVVLVLDAQRLVERSAQRAGFSDFRVDLADVTEADRLRPLVHTLDERAGQPGVLYRADLSFAQRQYLLRFAPAAPWLVRQPGWASWIVLTAGLLMTGLLGALLMLISGERARIEALVLDRTTRLRDREARLKAILESAADAIVTVDRNGKLVSANSATAALFGYPHYRLAGLPFVALVPAGSGESGPLLLARLAAARAGEREVKGVNASGERFPVAISVARVLLPNEYFFVCILRDLSEQYRSQEKIYRLAHHDELTGLENRFALRKRLDEQLAHARRAGEPLAVLFIDLDHFKKINDSFGHHAGDALLVAAAGRMRELLRDVDTLGRLGGDEFVIVLGGPLTPDSVSSVALRVVQSLTAPYQIAGATVHSGASVGVALYPSDGEDSAALLRHADTAMYAAKREGRGNFQFFSAAMNAATHEHLLLENRMWAALEEGGFDLHLQAQVDLNTGRVIGAEVLLRWHDAELGEVEPGRFIPIAEECGLILPLGDWVLSRTMQLLAEWQQDGVGPLRLAVNLSARQFSGSALLARLDQLLAQHRIDPSCLELEITETAAMRDPENTRHLLRQLRARGFKLAIDDFGTGYSSLAYLKLFAIDRIKIDRGFVKDIETNPNDAVIVAATIGLAHSLGLSVVAEGVETAAQWGFLRDKRGDEAQGYLFARPMPAREFREFIRSQALTVPGS